MSKESIEQEIAKRNIYNDDDSGKVYLIILVAPLIISLIVSFIVSQIAAGQEVTSTSISSTFGYKIAMFIIQILLYLTIFLLYNKWKNISFKAVNLKFKMNWQTYAILVFVGVISLFGIQSFIGSFDNLLKLIGFPLEKGLAVIEPTNWWKYIICTLFLALVPAIFEELLFRGMILNGLRSRFNDYLSIILTGLMFALMHQNLQQLVYPFLLGCIMGWAVLRTGSLVSSIVIHFVNNFLVVTFSFIEYQTGFYFVTKDIWWFYLVAVILLAVTMGIIYLIDKFFFKHKSAEQRERTSIKTSPYIYVSLAIGVTLWTISTILKFLS